MIKGSNIYIYIGMYIGSKVTIMSSAIVSIGRKASVVDAIDY